MTNPTHLRCSSIIVIRRESERKRKSFGLRHVRIPMVVCDVCNACDRLTSILSRVRRVRSINIDSVTCATCAID
ncbi:unnamed protein product [Trichogramma brassicae]|uniref:Uncharacterized protein n=1 Tax=Trichogramma brassicae TaxID=86971 RepID=A0A6H5J1R8_9HYME|nr:unnamed protein product [Trichogramma brassicae]